MYHYRNCVDDSDMQNNAERIGNFNMTLTSSRMTLSLNDVHTALSSLTLDGTELLSPTQNPLFSIRLRGHDHTAHEFSAIDADSVSAESGENTLSLSYRYQNFTVNAVITGGERFTFRIAVENHTDCAVEWIDFPTVTYGKALRAQGGDAAVLWGYNEGTLIEDARLKPSLTSPEYPSLGSYPMYPYMISVQFTAYLTGAGGVYMGAHDTAMAPKAIDFACAKDSTVFRTRYFCGGEYGGDIPMTYDTVWEAFTGDWHAAADIYRKAFRSLLQPSLKTVTENDALPDWYKKDMPLVITYPVRGRHDMDAPEPNALFPYENVLPIVDEMERRTGAKIMVLLMHWEGTAPWAPPYVWPPYGGEAMFSDFRDKLHARGDLLGVYCSGFSYTEQSNIVTSYNRTDEIERRNLWRGFCKSPEQNIPHSQICTAQRSGYDICDASPVGCGILNEALSPLWSSGVDYAQILDQNHGGTMYFCYAEDHGHPPVPGAWMTKATHTLLNDWNKACPHMLLGCESAAADANIANLALSDNRYELCYVYGRAVPLYAYLFHPYLHNFMGNQVCAPFGGDTESLLYRLSYSFAAGDLLTLVLDTELGEEGDILSQWSLRDFSSKPDKDEVIAFVAQTHAWHAAYPAVFSGAEMIKPTAKCGEHTLNLVHIGRQLTESALVHTAWHDPESGKVVEFLANYTSAEENAVFEHDVMLRRIPDSPMVKITSNTEIHVPPRTIWAVEY